MSDLADPQNFTLSSVVSKNSKSKEYKNTAGFTSNKRLLVIKKGYLYYYSNVPKNYKNDASTLDNLKDVPKCSIEILNIKKINGFQPNSNYFSIQFQAKHMMEKQDIRKTMTLQQFNFTPKNTKQYITWQFTCDNVAIKQNWVNSLESLKVHYTKEKAQMQSFFDNIQNKKDGQESISHRNSMNMPWIEKNNESNISLRKSQISKSYSSGKIPGNLSPTPGGKLQGDSPEKSPSLSKSNSYTQLQTSNVNILKGQSMIHPIVIREQEQCQQDQLKQNENNNDEDNEEENQGYQLRNQQFIRQQPIRFEQIKEQSQFSQFSDEEKRYNKKDLLLKESLDASIIDRPDTPEKRVGFLDDSLSNQNQSQQDFANEQPKSEQNKQIPIEAEQNISQTKSIKKYPNQLSVQNHKKGIVYKSRSLQINSQLKSLSIRKLTSTQSRPISDLIKITSYQFKVSPQSNFYELLYFSCNKEYSFQKRVEAQKKLNALVGTFTNKSIKTFTQFINTKGHSRKTSSRFNQQKINEDLSSLQIGTMRFKIGYVNTQTVLINGKQRIYYNQSQVKQLKKQMKVYDQINKMIAQQIKMINDSKSNDLQNTLQLSLFKSQAKIDNQLPPSSQKIQSNQQVSPIGNKISISQLRVPLCTYFQYKGVCAMSFDQTLAVSEKQISDKQKLGQLKEMMKKMGFNSTFLEFKSLKTEVGEVFIIYINSSNDIYINKPSKHHHVTFQSPMNTEFLKKAAKEGSSVSTQSLLKYIKAMNQIKDTSMFTCPKEQILIALQYCYLCKHLRKFYRATHAQIDESKFINLLLKGDNNITRLFQSSGFEFQARKNDSTQILGIFFQFLLYYLGIKCQVDIENLQKYGQLIPLGIQKKNSQKNSDKIVKMVKVLPRIIGFNLQFFQLYQTFKKIDHYLNNKSKQLVYKALEYKQSTYFQNPFQIKSYPWAAYTQCLYNSAQLNYIQNDYITSITKSKQYLCTASPLPDEQEGRWQIPTPSCCIPVYFLMMKCYSKFSRQKFNELLRQILDSTIYNFGQESSVTLTVFSFAALTFVGIGEYGQAQNFLQVAIKVGQKIYGPYKKLRLAELYIDYWKILKQQNKTEKAEQQFKKAQKIIQSYGTYEQKVNLELQGLEGMLKQSQLIEGQQKAMQMLHNLQKLLKKSSARISIVKRYYKIIYQIGIKYQKSQIYDRVIEQLWKIDSNSKVIAIQYAFKLVSGKLKSLPNQLQPLVKKYSLSKEKSLLKIEEKLKHYKNMTQMLLQSFTEFEQDLICAFLKILPPGSVKFT